MKAGNPETLLVAGVMSGTSADGVDVAITRITPASAPDKTPTLELLAHHSFPYPPAIRTAVLAAMDAEAISVAELSRLHWRLGEIFAECVRQICVEQEQPIDLVGLHGQTIFHQPAIVRYHGRPVRCTWQLGEAAVVRERLAIPVVADFRPADLGDGGQGAPLVPMLDFCFFRSPAEHRVLLNLGGIANITILPAAASLAHVIAFDTGPANMLIDALMHQHFNKPFDRNGAIAASGTVLPGIVEKLLHDPYFHAKPPKSCGREQFGAAFLAHFTDLCGPGAGPADLVATATELTARTVADAIHLHAPATTELIAAGGGVHNAHLMARFAELLPSLSLSTSDTHGLPAQAKEAAAFALLAWLTWFGLPGNIPSATGASDPRVLGKVSW